MRFKSTFGQMHRISFLLWPKNSSGQPDFTGQTVWGLFERHYHPQTGYVLAKPELKQVLGAPRAVAMTQIIEWPTKGGVLDPDALKKGNWIPYPWVVGGLQYERLRAIEKNNPFGDFDLVLYCNDEKFQKFEIQLAPTNLYRKLITSAPPGKNALVDQLRKDIESHFSRDLLNAVGRSMSKAEVTQAVLMQNVNTGMQNVMGIAKAAPPPPAPWTPNYAQVREPENVGYIPGESLDSDSKEDDWGGYPLGKWD